MDVYRLFRKDRKGRQKGTCLLRETAIGMHEALRGDDGKTAESLGIRIKERTGKYEVIMGF